MARKITVFYRDGGNYKFDIGIELTDKATQRIEKTIGKPLSEIILGPDNETDPDVQYDKVLGLSQDEFHNLIGTSYDEELDHPFVTLYDFNPESETIVHTITE